MSDWGLDTQTWKSSLCHEHCGVVLINAIINKLILITAETIPPLID